MGDYVDLRREAQDALELRASRRRRVILGIRGWLHQSQRPRWRAAGLLAVSLATGTLVSWLVWTAGLKLPICAMGLGIGVAWVGFAGLLQWQARRLYHATAAARPAEDLLRAMDHHVAEGLLAERIENHRLYAEPSEEELRWQRSFSQGLQNASQQGGPTSFPVLLIVGLLTLGTWILWDLLRCSPAILAEALLDGAVARDHPGIADRIAIEAGHANTLAGTALHFLSLGIVVILLVGALWALVN